MTTQSRVRFGCVPAGRVRRRKCHGLLQCPFRRAARQSIKEATVSQRPASWEDAVLVPMRQQEGDLCEVMVQTIVL